MIRITVELLPHGDESRKKVLGVGEIINDGTGTLTEGHYVAHFSRRAPQTHVTWRATRVENFPRKRLGAWDLLYRALDRAVGARNP